MPAAALLGMWVRLGGSDNPSSGGLDMSLVRVQAHRAQGEQAMVSVSQLYPVPDVEPLVAAAYRNDVNVGSTGSIDLADLDPMPLSLAPDKRCQGLMGIKMLISMVAW